jgi:hypothetical protein
MVTGIATKLVKLIETITTYYLSGQQEGDGNKYLPDKNDDNENISTRDSMYRAIWKE